MFKPYFDFRDIFRAPRLALSGKKMGIQFAGLLIGYIGFMVLTYIAFLFSEMTFSEIWESYGFFPLSNFTFTHWYSWLIFILGCVFFLFCWMLASAAVGKVTYEQLKGDEFYSTKDSLRFLKKHGKTVILSPLSLAVFAVFLIICGIIVGLLGKIPYAGELGFGLFYGVPLFVVAVFCVYVIFILIFSFLLTPAIVATTKEDIFEIIVQLFSTIWAQPWRFFVYNGIILLCAKVGSFILGYFCFRGVQLLNWSCGILMKDKLLEIFQRGLSYVTMPPWILDFFSNIFPKINFRFHLPEITWGESLSWSKEISAFLIGITLILIIFGVISYALATFSTGQTLTYIVLRKKKDEENLLEKKTEEEEEMEKIEETQKKGEAKEKEEQPEEGKEAKAE